ncbi:hypothetical protein [Shewanella algae]
MVLISRAGALAIDPVWPGHPGPGKVSSCDHQLPGGVAMGLISRAEVLTIDPA